MSQDEKEKGESYYAQNREARKQYQRNYYRKNHRLLARKRELQPMLDPERAEAVKQYQRIYYLTNRQELLVKRKERERKKREGRVPVSGIPNPVAGEPNPVAGEPNPEAGD